MENEVGSVRIEEPKRVGYSPLGNGDPKRSIVYKLRELIRDWRHKHRERKKCARRSRALQPPVYKKPVLYLFSPDEIDVSVTLSLTPELRFSVIYPIVWIKQLPFGEQLQWNVRTRLDGTLREMNTGLDVSYLFWEADVSLDLPPSPPPSPILEESLSAEQFSPVLTEICDSDAVVLPIGYITSYLEKVLKALGLHTEARTSFITFWLPSFLKHQYVALRFVPQSIYSRIAPLDIAPEPDVITRVFMVFKGISDEEEWPIARARATDDVSWWKEVVGVDSEKVNNTKLFRVLEWGGMEVHLR